MEVAMESTGVYWIPIFQILEAYGFDVVLVNARHVNNVPGRKTDVQDCQWLQYLHSVGLLRGSYRPAHDVCALRALLRHRDSVVKISSTHVQRIHKSLTQMNIQIHNVIRDITGLTGLAVVDAIVAGERDPKKLAALKHGRIKASDSVLVQSLEGN
jgi:transposase